MKKFAIALFALTASAGAYATGPCASAALDFSAGLATYDSVSASCTVAVTAKSATADTFIANNFTFTVSSGVAVSAVQDAQSMAVAAGAAKGRNVFTGHSNGGSVSQCNLEPITDTTANPSTLTGTDHLEILNIDGCAEKDPIVAA